MRNKVRNTALAVVLALCGGLLGALPAALVTSTPAGAALGAQDLASGATPTQLAQSIAGDGVTVSNVSYTGANIAAGKFSGAGTGAASVGFDSGVVLSSGRVAGVSTACTSGKGVEGPNVCTDNTTDNGTPGDAALTALAGVQTNDAAVLQFDFVPQFSTVQFQYVFGSEEYLEFVNSGVNDTFGFFVNGSNCATVPGTEGTPVSVDTINTGTNAAFFRNNGGASIDTELDGLTTVLQCNATVNPGVTNTMRLAIADGGDSILDSDAFIKAGSLISGTQVSGSLTGGGQSGTSISVPTATAVTAHATLSGVNAASAGGTATYSVFSNNTCTTAAGSGGTKTVSGGSVPASDAVTLNTAGTYYWKIAYSGDGLNNPSSTTCGELLETVTPPVATLAITSTGQPASVTAGADAVRTVTVTNTGAAPATGVTVAMTVPSGVTLVSSSPSQGSCGAVVSGVVTCTLGTIAAGGSVNVSFVLQAPAAVPAGGTFSTSASATSSGGGSAGPATSSTTVTPRSPGTATGFIPPGGTLRTGTDATAGDNTVTSLTLPNTGPGAFVTITSVPCAPGVCLGKTVFWNDFPGYNDPAKPITVVTTYDKTIFGLGLLQQEFVQRDGSTKFELIPPCSKPGETKLLAFVRFLFGLVVGGHTGIVSPSPCSDKKEQLGNGDLRYTSLFLSGDPGKRR